MKSRRPTSNVACIPKVGGRGSSAEKKRGFPRHPGVRRAGMTLIELGIVMGIVSVLLALVLGLGRHVNAVVKIRRAQAELGEWHETLNRWFLQFGEYPHAHINTILDSVDPLDSADWDLTTPSRYPLVILTNQCEIIFPTTNISFRSFLTSDVSAIDPWGSPYIYTCDPGRKAYTLFSCGPDAGSVLNGKAIGKTSTSDTTLDDIHFER